MLDQMLTNDRVQTDVECLTWREAVHQSGQLLVDAGDVEPVFIDSMIEVIEEFGPYMILAPEVAFFHGRPSEAVHRLCISLITLKNPVTFDEYDGEQIRCAFAFGAVDKESHIAVLMKVAQLLQDEPFLTLIRGNGSRVEILKRIHEVCDSMQVES